MEELLANILLVASQVGTLFLLMGVGFVLTRLGKLTKTGVAQLTFVLMNIVSPCIIIDTLQVERTPALLRDMGVGVLIMCAVYALWIALAAPPSAGRKRTPGTCSASAWCTATRALWACP